MANALNKAPLLKEEKWANETLFLEKEYDTEKKYVYRLAEGNNNETKQAYEVANNRSTPVPTNQFKPFQNVLLSSQIVWKGGRKNIRYYDGCESIFVSEQPKEKDVIDQLIAQTRLRHYADGYVVIEGYDKMLLLFMDICSWNIESPFRTNSANGIFLPMNADKKATAETEKLDSIETALGLAKEASSIKMWVHAAYLGIPTIDFVSGNELTEKEVRSAYRKRAMEQSTNFIESYGNKLIELKYFIDKALMGNVIQNKLNPNKAAWANSGSEICDISGLKSNEAIGDRLLEFSQTEEGEDFAIQIKALYSK